MTSYIHPTRNGAARRAASVAFALVLSLWLGMLPGYARSAPQTRNVPVRTMLELLDAIDKSPALSPAKAGELLKTPLEPVPEESTEYFHIFRGHGGPWKEAELRLPRGGDGRRFVLVLTPAKEVSMEVSIKAVTDHYGKEFAVEPPNPAAGEQAMMAYIYKRATGTLRFSFTDLQQDTVRVILFDHL